MKIDTSKLTPVQAQQIEAIASGIHFTLQHYTGTGIWNSPLSIYMTQIQDPSLYDGLIEYHQSKLTDGSITDPKIIESQHEHIAMLERRRQGMVEWVCTYSVKSERYFDLPVHWKAGPHGDRLMAKIRDRLTTEYGLENGVTMSWLYPDSITRLESWTEVVAWHTHHSALDQLAIVATVDSIVDEYLAAMTPIERLSLKRGHIADRLKIWRHHSVHRPFKKLKASLTKALDILRPKA